MSNLMSVSERRGRYLSVPGTSFARSSIGSVPVATLSVQDQALMRRLGEIGYEGCPPPKPLFRAAAHDVLGIYPAQRATPDQPIALGPAEIVAIGASRDLVVVRIVGRGDYYARLSHDLLFAGRLVPLKGRLFFAKQFYVFCSADCPFAEVVRVAHEGACSDRMTKSPFQARSIFPAALRRYRAEN